MKLTRHGERADTDTDSATVASSLCRGITDWLSRISVNERRSCTRWARRLAMSALLCSFFAVASGAVAAENAPAPKQPGAGLTQPSSLTSGSGINSQTPALPGGPDSIQWVQVSFVAAGMAIVVCIVLVLMQHMKELRTDLAKLSVGNESVRKDFIQMALGVPDGTIRSALAILIIVGSLLALIAEMAGKNLGLKVPDVLAGVFGTILGFYFGRTGSVEAGNASRAVASASEATAQATKTVVAANEKTAQATSDLDALKSDQADTLSTRAQAAFTVEKAVVSALPEPVDPAISTGLADAGTALNAAQSDGSFDELTTAYNKLVSQGPIASLIRATLPSLAPLAPPGSSPLDAIRELLTLSAKVPPPAAQLWIARVLRQPYRVELFTPAFDEAQATALIAQVPGASDLYTALLLIIPTLAKAEFVSMSLTEDGAAQMASRSKGSIAVDTAAPLVDALQQRAIEAELSKSLTDGDAKPLGGLRMLFANLDTVLTNPAGQSGLDTLMLIVRQARLAGVPATDLVPPASEG
jgi:hypothetical protein